MRHKKVMMSTVVLLVLGLLSLHAQQTTPASGGNSTGTGGSASYSVGQVAYTTLSSASGTITQGVQQPYEIFEVTGLKEVGINLGFSVYPNPTAGSLHLKIENYDIKNLKYHIYDINGTLVQSKKVDENETQVSLEKFVPGVYFMKVTDNNKDVKTFKIIKN